MYIKNNASGQAMLLTVMLLGVILAGLLYWGWSRDAEFSKDVGRVDAMQTANEVLTAASKRVQHMYMNDSSCDPVVLETNLQNLPTLPATYSGTGTITYAIADPSEVNSASRRFNLCSYSPGTASGCRQFAVEQDSRAYVVTVGLLAYQDPVVTTTCAQDAVVKLKTTIRGFTFSRKVTLINLCSYKSCVGPSFSTATSDVSLNTTKSSVCGVLPAHQYGDIVGTTNIIDENDLRWARRYLESGGADIGFTNYIATSGTISTGNGSCAPASSAGQCHDKNCIPGFDLDLNGTNDEADLAIMEYYLRGYLTELPVKRF